MKIRLLNNSLRVRISQSEVTTLLNDKVLMAHTSFPSRTLHYKVVGNANKWAVRFNNDTIMIGLPEEFIEDLGKPDFIGDKHEVTLQDGQVFTLLFEKDFKCLIDREEDETDLFENPQA